MPMYEYECEECRHRFEVIQKFSDAPIETCPKCGGMVRKLLSSPAIQFKGSGWYITDYAKKDSEATGAKTDSSAPADATAKSDATEKKTEKTEKTDKTEKRESTASKAPADPAK